VFVKPPPLKFIWAQVLECRMSSAPIVEHLNVLEDGVFELSSCGPTVYARAIQSEAWRKSFQLLHCPAHLRLSPWSPICQFPSSCREDDRGVLKTLGLEWWITPLWGCLRLMAMFRAHTANSDVIRLPHRPTDYPSGKGV
jgi:hypothetical protein